MPIEKLKVLDLFSGIGGFTLGLERTGGFETIAFCEIDAFCQKILSQHWPLIPIHADIRALTSDAFTSKPDLICGGFPCQDISVAGKKAGLDGKRSGLWFEMLRLISELRPSWVLIENVPNLRTKGADIVFTGLEEEGYCWTSAVVGAWAVGAPHQRNRVWILAHSERDGRGEGSGSMGGSWSISQQARNNAPPNEEGRQLRIETPGSSEICEPFTNWTIEPEVGRMADGIPDRPHRIKALGNAVVPQIPELFGKFILSHYAQSI